MTREEAIARIKDHIEIHRCLERDAVKIFEALDMAIKSLNYSETPNTSDTISRQAAVDAMCELMHHWFGGNPKDEIREIKRELEKLPSAQSIPTKTEDLIRRGDAIEAIYRRIKQLGLEHDADVLSIRQAVREVPSTQPEIIRCKDCEWFRKEYGWNCIEYTVCGISPMHHPIRREDDFCSMAERREE